MKCILSIQRYNMTHNLKEIRAIFKNLLRENNEDEYINVELRPRSSIVDIKIKSNTLLHFSKVCRALLESDVKDAVILFDLLMNIFKMKNGERYSDDRKKAGYKLYMQDDSNLNIWEIKPIEISICKVLKALNAGKIYTMEVNRKAVSAIGVVRIHKLKKEFYMINTYRHPKSEMDFTDYLDQRSAFLLLLLYNANNDFEDEEVFIDVENERYYCQFTSYINPTLPEL